MHEQNHPCRQLAVGVITQAVQDLRHRNIQIQRSANMFFFGDDRSCLSHWIDQAGWSPSGVLRRLDQTTPAQLVTALAAQRVTRRP